MSYVIRWIGGVNAGGFDDMVKAAHAIVDSSLETVVQVREQMSDRVVATIPFDGKKPDIWDIPLEPSKTALETANKILGYLPIGDAAIAQPSADTQAIVDNKRSSLDEELHLWDGEVF